MLVEIRLYQIQFQGCINLTLNRLIRGCLGWLGYIWILRFRIRLSCFVCVCICLVMWSYKTLVSSLERRVHQNFYFITVLLTFAFLRGCISSTIPSTVVCREVFFIRRKVRNSALVLGLFLLFVFLVFSTDTYTTGPFDDVTLLGFL